MSDAQVDVVDVLSNVEPQLGRQIHKLLVGFRKVRKGQKRPGSQR